MCLPMPEMMISAVFPAGDRVFLTLSTSFTSPSVMLSWAVMTDCVMPFARSISMSLDGVRATTGSMLTMALRGSHGEMERPYEPCMRFHRSRTEAVPQHSILQWLQRRRLGALQKSLMQMIDIKCERGVGLLSAVGYQMSVWRT